MKKIANLKIDKIPFGGDWNPEQWEPEIWEEDIKFFKQANIDLVTLNVFSWTLCQPEEDVYTFEWLDKIIALCKKAGIKVCLGTGTAAHPAWMASRYPDILRIDFQGRKRKFGDRHNSCPSSPTYRKFAPLLAGQLAEHYKNEPLVILWHVSNEYMGACYCPNCENKFRNWLKDRYKTLAALNQAWYTKFWNQTITAWEQIVLPNVLTVQWGERNTAMQSISLDFMRFNSDNILECFCLEYEAIKKIIPEAIVTTNFMRGYRGLNYRRWAERLDVISLDSYPQANESSSQMAFFHVLSRGLKNGQPYLLMEQTPSQTNWQEFNPLKRPGIMRLQSYQALAQGADSVLFFQMRRSRGNCEKFHGAVIEHSGRSDTRVFREISQLGVELKKLGKAFLGSTIKAEAALWFDWECYWAAENSMGICNQLNYCEEIILYFEPFHKRNVQLDIIGPGADLTNYKLLLVPVIYLLSQGTVGQLKSFVERGGILLATYLSGVADETDLVFKGGPPGPLKEILGLWIEETDVAMPEQKNEIVVSKRHDHLIGRYQCSGIFDILRLEGAEVIGEYGKDFYAKSPVLTRHKYGQGEAWYLGSRPDKYFLKDFGDFLIKRAGLKASLPNIPEGLEVTERSNEKGDKFIFILNHSNESKNLKLPKDYFSLLEEKMITGEIVITGLGDLILKEAK